MARPVSLQFVGMREFKEGLAGYLGTKKEVVVTRRGKPIARIAPVAKGSAEDLLLEMITGDNDLLAVDPEQASGLPRDLKILTPRKFLEQYG